MTAITKKAQDTRSASVNTLLVIGAGEAQNIDADWQNHYRRLVLVEPLPDRAQFLRQTFGENPDVEFLEAAIVPGATPGDTTTLYEYNWPQATSRHQPAELLQLFPGLKTERMWRVAALSPQQLIQEIGLPPEGEHGLILEAPADEGPILAALVESNAYKYFSYIQFRYPVAGLYDTPEDPENMLQALTACGFEIESQDRTDPDWPSMSLIRNRWKIALEEARGTIKALEAQLAEQAEALTAAEQLAEARRMLIAGASNTLGRLAALTGPSDQKVLEHFRSAISISDPEADVELLLHPMAARQLLSLAKANGSNSISDMAQRKRTALSMAFLKPEIQENPDPETSTPNDPIPSAARGSGSANPAASKDDNITPFIHDLAPYFLGESITYVDIGAFTGSVFIKIRSLNKIKIREAHLIEPNPKSFEELKENIKEARLPSLHTYRVAILDTEGKMSFLAAGSMTKLTPVDDEVLESDGQTFECRTVSLDSISENFTDRRIGLLKIDTEGTELEVLLSGQELLDKQLVDVIYLEVGFNKSGKQQTYFTDIDNLLTSYGYRVFGVYEQTREWIEDLPVLRRSNMAYMSSKFAAANKTSLVKENERLRALLGSKGKERLQEPG